MTFRWIAAAGAALAVLATPAAASAEPPTIPEGSICAVFDQTVTLAQFDAIMASARQGYRDTGRPFPAAGTDAYRELADQAVDFLVSGALTVHAAATLGITVSDADVEQAFQDLIEDYFDGSVAKFRAELTRTSTSEEQVRADLRRQLLEERVFEQIVAPVPRATDAQARAFYAKHPELFRVKKSRAVAHILVKRKAKAASLYAQLQGKPYRAFSAAAQRHSIDPASKNVGGRLTISQGQTVKSFDQIAFSLERGTVSKPFKTEFGWHIVFAIGAVKPAHLPTFGAVRAEVHRQVNEELRTTHFDAWEQQLRTTSAPSIACVASHPWSA